LTPTPPPRRAYDPAERVAERLAAQSAEKSPEKSPERSGERSSPAPKKGRSGGVFRAIFLLILCILVGGGAGYYMTQRTISGWEAELEELAAQTIADLVPTPEAPPPTPEPPPPTPTPPPATPTRTDNALSAVEIAELGRQQVVGITTEITTTNVFGQEAIGRVSGSGFILSREGYILTNYHVIEGANRIMVMLDDYSMHEAQLIGGEGVTSDMAVLKIDATALDLSAAVIGNSSEMRVGSPIYAIGNPLGELTFTITSGIVSALNREVTIGQGQVLNMFQIDAAVNSGNSGGPVYNEMGEVVGIVTAKTALEGVEGIGFAIPIDDAMYYATQLIEQGYIPRPHLGIAPATVSDHEIQYYHTTPGVRVESVYPGTAAEQGGLEVGDIITAINGVQIRTAEELRARIASYAPGVTVVLTVFRGGSQFDLPIVLGDRPPG